jgi:prepilin-type processing-associated H-X9-DG protein
MLRYGIACLLVVFTLVSGLRAQPMIESVPPDAIVYIGWRGANSMPPEYAQSHLKAIADASQFRQLFTETLPRLAKLIEREEPEAGRVMSALSSIAEPMWKYPTAIYFGGFNTTNKDTPLPRLAAMIQAGGDAPALVANLQQQIAKLGPSPVPVTVAEAGGVIALVVGELPTPATDQASLAKQASFTAAMSKVKADGVITLYVDVEAGLKMIDEMLLTYEGKGDQEDWATARDALNLGGIKRIAYSGSFDGQDWRDDAYVQAPAPRTGVAALMDLKPLGPDALAAIPHDATLAFTGRMDLTRLMQEIRTGVAKADADTAKEMEQGLAQINDRLDMDLEKDLLEPMGDQWAFYAADRVGGDGLMAFCLVNKLDDPAKVDQSLWQLSQLANEAMKDVGDGDVTLAFKQFERDGIKVGYLAVPVVSPSWAIKDGNLYIALYPQVVISAAQHVSNKGKSLAENPQYQAIRQRLGTADAGYVTYIDMERRVPAGYSSMLLFLRLYLGMADLFGAQSPAMVLPPLNVIMQHLSPSGAVGWSDEDGYHMRQIQPFPMSTNLATSDVSTAVIGQQAMMISILLPSLNRARETANRVKCASNMRQIGQATLLYANENRQKMPPDLGTLLKTQDIGMEVFICPSSSNAIPGDVRNAPIDRQAAWVNENASFVWLVPADAGLTFNMDPEIVLLHERVDNHDRDGMNLLYADGHVEFAMMAQAHREIEKSKQALEKLAAERKSR